MSAFTLTVPAQLGAVGLPFTVAFDAAKFTHGFPQVDSVYDIDLLRSNSVNASRERLNRYDYPPFGVRLVAGLATFDLAVAAARAFRGYRGFYCNFTVTMQGTLHDFSSSTFYITDILATPVPGPFFGGAVSPSEGHIVVEMDLRKTL